MHVSLKKVLHLKTGVNYIENNNMLVSGEFVDKPDFAKYNKYAAVVAAAVVCPLVNTGVFLIGCLLFFLDTIKAWGANLGFTNTVSYVFLGMVGGNFLFELASNMILSPVILRILNFKEK